MAENRQDKSVHLQNSAGSRPSSATRDDTMHWFAHLGPPSNGEDKEARIKTFKERQNEERQRKLDEMKNQALAAQRFKEQKEQERRQRLEELRVKEDERRQQVEERKKAINDAERDRLESILKRNQEREARIEAKRRSDMKSSMVFAFGSSTPRVLGPADNTSSFWGHRRATSTQNITYSPAPLTRRQSERELDGGSKKRATSAGGIERSGEDMRMSTSMYAVFHWDDEPDSSKSISNNPAQALSPKTATNFAGLPQHPAGCISGYVGRRRTDLMPTIPAKESPSTPPRKPFMRSPAPSRPSSSLSQQSTSSVTSSVIMRSRPATAPRRPRPASIAITGITITTNDLKNGTDLKKPENKPPLPKIRKSSLVKSQEKIGKKKSFVSPTEGSPKSILSPTTTTTTTTVENLIDIIPIPVSLDKEENVNVTNVDENKLVVNRQVNKDVDIPNNQQIEQLKQIEQHPSSDVTEDIQLTLENINLTKGEKGDIEKEIVKDNIVKDEGIDNIKAPVQNDIFENQNNEADMTTSMSSKPRITTEEEAKAALAERRRIAREEAEKQAELERLRIEEEMRLEIERQQREEEQQRQLIELQRAAEEERLKEAIKERQRREEEERLRREEELRSKILKEEAERKAREETERQKAELQERLKNEEKEREARRKRVEAIMLRTRGKNNSNLPQTEEKNAENTFDSKVNGSKTDAEENGHKNGKEIETVDNIIPVDTIKNANTVNVTTLSTDDTLNSNDAWQRNSQKDLLM